MNYYNKKNLTKHQITGEQAANIPVGYNPNGGGQPNPMDMLMQMGLDPALIQKVMSGDLSGIPPEILSTIQSVLGQMGSGSLNLTNKQLENIAIQEKFPNKVPAGFSNNLEQLMDLGKEYIPKQKGGQFFKKGGPVKKQMPSVPKYKAGGQIGKSNYMQALRNFKNK